MEITKEKLYNLCISILNDTNNHNVINKNILNVKSSIDYTQSKIVDYNPSIPLTGYSLSTKKLKDVDYTSYVNFTTKNIYYLEPTVRPQALGTQRLFAFELDQYPSIRIILNTKSIVTQSNILSKSNRFYKRNINVNKIEYTSSYEYNICYDDIKFVLSTDEYEILVKTYDDIIQKLSDDNILSEKKRINDNLQSSLNKYGI